MCNKFPQQPRYHVFLKLDTLNLRPYLSRLIFARSVDGILRNEMEDTAAGVGKTTTLLEADRRCRFTLAI